MSLDCEVYDVSSNQIYSCLNSLGWVILKYLHDKEYVSKEDIEKCFYTVQLNKPIILEIINELIKYFNDKSLSYYKDYEIDESEDLGHVLGILHQIYNSMNENSEVYLDAYW